MRSFLIVVAMLLAPGARAAIGTGLGIGGSDPTYAIEHGTFAPTGTWSFLGPVSFAFAPVTSASVTVSAPILGDGSIPDPLRLDSSSVTLQGQGVVRTDGTKAMTGTLTVPQIAMSGLTDFGGRTSAQIRALVCASIPCRVQSSTDFDLYTATGTSAGQWRNSRLGTGP